MKRHVFLSGASENVSEEQSTAWRLMAEQYFESCKNIDVINPMRVFQKSSDFSAREAYEFCMRKIVREADVVLVNLADIRKSVGTVMELQKAHDMNLEIVGFCESDIPLDPQEEKDLFHGFIVDGVCGRIETGKHAQLKAMEYVREIYDY